LRSAKTKASRKREQASIDPLVSHRTTRLGSSTARARRELRTRLAYVFQDPARSLNPRMRVESILLAGLRYTSDWRGVDDGRERALAALEAVGLAARHLSRRPPAVVWGLRKGRAAQSRGRG